MKKTNVKFYMTTLICILTAIMSAGCSGTNETAENTKTTEESREQETSETGTLSEDSTKESQSTEENTIEEVETTTGIPFWMAEEYSYIIKPGEVKSLHIDIDNDGKDEFIEIYATEPMDPNQFPDTMMRIIDGEQTIFQTDNFFVGLSHCSYGNTRYYIVNESQKNYLLEYYTDIWQGTELYRYRLIRFSADGTSEVVKTDDADLSVSPDYNIVENGVYNKVQDTLKFNDDMMKYLDDDNTILLFNLDTNYEDMVYSYDGNVKGADARIDKDPLDQYSWDVEGDTLEERVRALCEYWQRRKEQDAYMGGME